MKITIPPLGVSLLITVLPVLGKVSATASDDPASEAFFEKRIRPALIEHCYECHSAESGKSKGGLLLDTRAASLEGGDTGPAIVPGNPSESLLLVAMRHEDPDLEMPPKSSKLPNELLSDFEAWIAAGAVDPREGDSAPSATDEMSLRLNHWSYQPITQPSVPEVEEAGWPDTAIDRFVLAQLEKNELRPSPDADARTLVRRLYFDLTGLPPSPEQVAAFDPSKLEDKVDELLASDGFGGRWGRHWLDVVRFGESNGREANIIYPHAWRYRDYVIDAVNRDLPFDRFLLEQVAGDLLPAESEEERARLMIATGFLALGAKGLASQDKAMFTAEMVDEQLDALGRGFLASSLSCARCHDHKSDPVTMTDYYSLIGIFLSTKTYFGTWIDSENNTGGELLTLPDLPGQLKPGHPIEKEKVEEMKAELAQLDAKKGMQDTMTAGMNEEQKKEFMRENFNEVLRMTLRDLWRRGGLEGKLATVDDEGELLPLCMGVEESEEMRDSPLYVRGDLKHPSDAVPRGIPALFGMEAVAPKNGDSSGRLALAHWLSDEANPLTARVMANRIWGHLFGAWLVSTPDNFGHSGALPSHPELLDYLAVRFQDGGWSVKGLVREIVLSRAYRQSSTYQKGAFQKDPENRLLWRANKRRLDAESIRDSMLAVAGTINLSPRPASLAAEVKTHSVSIIGFDKSIPSDLDGTTYRSIYLPVFRENLPDVLSLFDFAEPSLVVGKRAETNVPPQALYLMNSEFVYDQAKSFAARVMESGAADREARIHRAFQLCYNRDPDSTELAMSNRFFEQAEPGTEEDILTTRFCQALFASPEFRIAD